LSDTSNLNAILSCAKEKEQEFDWCGAIESYSEALSLMSQQDLAEKGEIVERLGYASFRFAFQAESKDEFKERLKQAILSYEKAKKTYEKLTESVETPRTLRCEAMIAYLRYWLSSETDKKRRLIDRCWKLTQETLRAFGETGDSQEFGKTYNQLSGCAGMKECFQWESQAREKTLKEAIELGEKTIMFLSADSDICKLATAYVRTAAFSEAFSYFALNPYDQKNRREKALQYWLKANTLSEETAFCEFFYSLQVEFLGWEPGTDSALAFFNKALEYGRKSRDKLVFGGALDWLAYHTIWKTFAVEDVDDRIDLTGKALQYAEDAKCTFSLLSYTSPRSGLFWIEAPYPEYYGKLITCEADPKRRRDLREKALDAASEYLGKAESSGYPDVILLAHHILSNQLAFLAESEKDSYEKTRLLEKALNHRNESIRISEGVSPPAFLWDRGLMWSGLARIKSELADLAKGHEPKKNLLVEAAAAKEESLRLCR